MAETSAKDSSCLRVPFSYTPGSSIPMGGVIWNTMNLDIQANLSIADLHLCSAGFLIVPLLSLNVRICKMWTLKKCRLLQGHCEN